MMKKIFAVVLCLLLALPLASQAAVFNTDHATAFMSSRFNCGCTIDGSGAMISRYGLVTAAHNLYCYQHGEKLKSCDFYFGAKSANSCWYKYDGKFTYWTYEDFKNGYDSANDIGVVIFDAPVGDETGWFGYWVGSDRDLNEEYTHVLAYDQYRHMQDLFEIQYVYSSTELYWQGWLGGTAGGPVYLWGEGMEYPMVVAVYTAADNDGNGYGRRLTADVIQDMRDRGAFR